MKNKIIKLLLITIITLMIIGYFIPIVTIELRSVIDQKVDYVKTSLLNLLLLNTKYSYVFNKEHIKAAFYFIIHIIFLIFTVLNIINKKIIFKILKLVIFYISIVVLIILLIEFRYCELNIGFYILIFTNSLYIVYTYLE